MRTSTMLFSLGLLASGLLASGPLVSLAAAQCPIETLVSPSPVSDRFGGVLAINDRHLVVLDSRPAGAGVLLAYRREASGAWTPRGEIGPPGLHSDASLDGDTLLIADWYTPDCPAESGARVFRWIDGAWTQTDRLCATIQAYRGELQGDMALISDAFARVMVFVESAGAWTHATTLTSPDSPSVRSDFGATLAISEGYVAIGAPLERIVAGNGGAVYVYRRLSGGGLELAQKLVASDVLRGPRFGSALAISGDTLVVGGYIADRRYPDQGVVYVYRLVEGQWAFEQELAHANPAEDDHFGWAVATDGRRIVASAPYADTRFLSAGRVYVFERDGSGAWVQTQDFDHHLPSYRYGTVLGLGGGVAAAGPGTAYVDLVDLTTDCCKPDLDGDGALTLFDFLAFQSLFDAGDARADFDGDGDLTFFDFLVFQSDFVDGCD